MNRTILFFALGVAWFFPVWASARRSHQCPKSPATSQTMLPAGSEPPGPRIPTNPQPAGIKLNTLILGSTTTPSTLSGTVSDLVGTSTYSTTWGGVVPALQVGRVALGVVNSTINGALYKPLPSSFVVNATGASTLAPQVVFVPDGSVVSYISSISLTQGNHMVNPLVQGRDATLIIQGCSSLGFNANFEVTVEAPGLRSVLSASAFIDSRINDGAWDGDPSDRYASVVIPGRLVVPGMSVKVTLLNSLGTNMGRPELFPTTVNLGPSVDSFIAPVPIIHLVPVSVGGVLPPMFTHPDQMDRFVKAVRDRLPFGVQFVIAPTLDWDTLVRLTTPPWEQPDPTKVWMSVEWGLLYLHRPETLGVVIGVIDGNSAPGRFLGGVASGMTIKASGGQYLPSAAILDYGPETSAEILAHEFGHQSQREHAPSVSLSGQVAANPDGGYPYQMANSTTATGFTAVYTGIERYPARGLVGSSTEQLGSHDIMSYGGYFQYNYPSDYTWDGVLGYWKSKMGTMLLPVMGPTQDPLISSALNDPDPAHSFLTVESSLLAVP